MGAFFLFRKDEAIDKEAVRSVFGCKGFSEPEEFRLGRAVLWLFRKQLVGISNHVISARSGLFATGTVVYKGKRWREGLESLLSDFERGTLEYRQMQGAFCLIFYSEGKLLVLSDRANVYHIFANRNNTVLSSSFLAVIASAPGKLKLNRTAVVEQFITGYVVGRETPIEGVSLVHDSFVNNTGGLFSLMRWQGDESEPLGSFKDFWSCVESQIRTLRGYYGSIGQLASEYGVDIGLSGGYDSRLNLLLSDSFPVSVHTHSSCDHSEDSRVAGAVAARRGLRLKTVRTRSPSQMSEEELLDNLREVLYFFDGRTNDTMGTFHDVYTRRYRIAVLDRSRLGLSGLGGELYRNHDHTYYSRLDYGEWIRYHVMEPHSSAALNSSDRDGLIDRLKQKYNVILRIQNTGKIRKTTARRLFAEVLIPCSAGVKSKAENQLAFFLMPFTEFNVSRAALKATPFLGTAGKFEAAMIVKLNSGLASVPSIYGFGFDRVPFGYAFRSGMRCLVPDRMRNILGAMLASRRRKAYCRPERLERYSSVRRIIELLRDSGIPLAWDHFLQQRACFERAISIGYFLHQFQDKISFSP